MLVKGGNVFRRMERRFWACRPTKGLKNIYSGFPGAESLSSHDKILDLTHNQYKVSCLEAWRAQMASLDPVFPFRKQLESCGHSET